MDPVELLRAHGLPAAEVLGAGMEGTAVALADGTVAKVWHHATPLALSRLQRFSAALDPAALPFAVPRVLSVLELDGVQVTVQPRVTGTPLWSEPGVSPPVSSALVDAVVTVLDGLAAVPVVPDLALLPVLPGHGPFSGSFTSSLADLVLARAALPRRPADYEALVDGVVSALGALPAVPPRLLHGDLVPGNILLSDGRVSGVLDFGFLTTLGDPVFDAAVVASITDMYGEHARRTEALLDRELARPPERVALYRLAYALVTATCFSASGSDGHFAWCLAQLERPELREAAGV